MKLPYLRRQYFRRFLRPINRAAMTPEYVGLSVFFGLLWGVTPTVGFQLIGVGLMWLIFNRLCGMRFSVPIAVLLTGVTNPLTVVPIYTLYYFVGSFLLGSDRGIYAPRGLIQSIAELDFSALLNFSETHLLRGLGIIFVGSIPFTIVACFLGYRFGHMVASKLHHRRTKRKDRRRSFLRRTELS